jgi:hypothetical protein
MMRKTAAVCLVSFAAETVGVSFVKERRPPSNDR